MKRHKELRALTDRISAYARTVHKQFPTGDAVVSERDLAEELCKRTDMVATALNLLLKEQKVQRAPLILEVEYLRFSHLESFALH